MFPKLSPTRIENAIKLTEPTSTLGMAHEPIAKVRKKIPIMTLWSITSK